MPSQTPTQQERSTLSDEELVDLAIQGDSSALELLLGRHQTWIYNLLVYMLHRRLDAEDATQEVLVKIATGLSGFQGVSSFCTWARRIAVNHALDCRRSRPEQVVTGFGCYADYLARAPDADFEAGHELTPEETLLIDEARTSCVMGMLLCLGRKQRVVFLLGEILETGDKFGAELLDMTRENFRQHATRAREALQGFMQERCGLLNPNNPCRCARKTQAFIRDGIVDPSRIQFATGHLKQLESVVGDRQRALEELVADARQGLYPLFQSPNIAARIAALLDLGELRIAAKVN